MKKCVSAALTVLGSIGLAWFILPILIYRVFNVGTVFGIMVFTLVFLYGRYFDKVNDFIESLRKEKKGKILLPVVSLIIIFGIVLCSFETYLIAAYAANNPTGETTVIILGCKANGNSPSLTLLKRLEAAKDYLELNPHTKCIVTGGQGHDEIITEAECMYNWLTDNGIEPSRIYKEDKSTSTRENLEFAKDIIERENLCKNITIVTNEFHQYRAGRIAHNLGFECTAISGRSPVILLPTYVFREYISIAYEWIR
ncbi:MAG: YdcF family protein [Clostridia bacterium]|nr:YdcF family protein [Clostridia bacterium]